MTDSEFRKFIFSENNIHHTDQETVSSLSDGGNVDLSELEDEEGTNQSSEKESFRCYEENSNTEISKREESERSKREESDRSKRGSFTFASTSHANMSLPVTSSSSLSDFSLGGQC